MWVVFQKKDRRVVGMTAVAEQDLSKADALAEIVRGLVQKEPLERYDAVQMSDRAAAAASVMTHVDQIAIEDSSRGTLTAVVRRRDLAALVLRSDAPDVHEVDGIPEIAADGSSFTTVTIQKVTRSGEPQNARSDNDTLHLRATAGTIMSADGREAIRKLKLKQGQASFRLVSEKARRVATVTVFNADEALENASIQIEFV